MVTVPNIASGLSRPLFVVGHFDGHAQNFYVGNPDPNTPQQVTLVSATVSNVIVKVGNSDQDADPFGPPQHDYVNFNLIGNNILQDGSLTVGSQEGRGLIGPDNPIVANPQTALINGDLELRDNGLISVSAGGSELTMQMGTLDNNGIIFVNGAKAVIDDPVTGTGGIDLGSDFAKDVGKLEFGSSVGHGQFIGLNAGNLQLDQPMQFAGSMSFLSGLNNEPPAPAISPQILLWKILS